MTVISLSSGYSGTYGFYWGATIDGYDIFEEYLEDHDNNESAKNAAIMSCVYANKLIEGEYTVVEE